MLPGSEDCDFFSTLSHHIGGDEATSSITNMSNFHDDMDLSSQAFRLTDECKGLGKYVNYRNLAGLTAESETSSSCSESFVQCSRPYASALKKEDNKPAEVTTQLFNHNPVENGQRDYLKRQRTGGVPGTRRKASHHARTILMDWIYAHRGEIRPHNYFKMLHILSMLRVQSILILRAQRRRTSRARPDSLWNRLCTG